MTLYYESIRGFLMESAQETNAVICRLMFGYETKDLLFLPNDCTLFGICHEEWDDRGGTNITVKYGSAVTSKTKYTHKHNWEPFRPSLYWLPPLLCGVPFSRLNFWSFP